MSGGYDYDSARLGRFIAALLIGTFVGVFFVLPFLFRNR